jgi:hypothetical protein
MRKIQVSEWEGNKQRQKALPAFFLFLLLVLAGCNNDQSYLPQVEQGQTTTIEAGASTQSQPVLTAADLPFSTGTKLVFWANEPGVPAKVDFNLEGPWDFSTGPTFSTLQISFIPKDTAPNYNFFPEADIAARLSWEPPPSGDEYIFQSLDAASWRSYGKSDSQGATIYSMPSQALLFPAGVGKNWVSAYTRNQHGSNLEVLESCQIVSFNKLTVPAGTFDAFLIQVRVAAKSGENSTINWDYIWIVPGLGRAAEIVSQAGEEDPLFNTAYAVYRLKSF